MTYEIENYAPNCCLTCSSLRRSPRPDLPSLVSAGSILFRSLSLEGRRLKTRSDHIFLMSDIGRFTVPEWTWRRSSRIREARRPA